MKHTNVVQIAEFCKNSGYGVSKRYTAVNSGTVLNAFMDAGYTIAGVYAGRHEHSGWDHHWTVW